MPERRQSLCAQRAIADQRPTRTHAIAPFHQPDGNLSGQQFVIRKAAAQFRGGECGGELQAAQRRVEARPILAFQQRRIMPFRHALRHAAHRFGDRFAQMPGEQAGGERPDLFDGGEFIRLTGGGDVVGMGDLTAIIDFAAHQHPRAGAQLRLGEGAEEHQIGESAAIGDGDFCGLAGGLRALDADDIDLQRHHLAGQRIADQAAFAAVEIGFGQMEQQIDHAIPTACLRHQLG